MIGWALRRQDLLLAAAVGLAGVVPAITDSHHVPLALAVTVALAIAVGVRRRCPLPALAAALALGVTMVATGAFSPFTAGFVLADVVLVFTVARLASPPVACAALVLTVGAYWAEDAIRGHGIGEYAFGAVFAAIPWLLARYVVRQQRLRARLSAAHDAERAALARAAGLDERRRIARDLHGVVSRGLAEIAIHAEAAGTAYAHDALAAREPVRAINAVALESVAQMRHLLDVLRGEQAEWPPAAAAARRRRVPHVSLLLAAAVALVGAVTAPPRDYPVVVLVAAAVALRRYAVVALSAVLATDLVLTALHPQPGLNHTVLVAALILLYATGTLARAAVSLGGLAIGLAGFWASDAMTDNRPASYVAGVVFAGGAWLAGVVVGREGRLRAALVTALDGARHALVLAAAADERRRVAREMHDVVAHGLSAIAVQSSAADAALELSPERALGPIRAIDRLAGECAVEMRRLLGTLPADGTPDLPAVIAAQAALGLQVCARIEPLVLPEAVRAALARIVQEALTNVRRHSGAERADVVVEVVDGWLRVAVEDAGPVRAQGPAGHGTTGIRERVTALDGRVTIGPHDGGWRVAVELPIAVAVA